MIFEKLFGHFHMQLELFNNVSAEQAKTRLFFRCQKVKIEAIANTWKPQHWYQAHLVPSSPKSAHGSSTLPFRYRLSPNLALPSTVLLHSSACILPFLPQSTRNSWTHGKTHTSQPRKLQVCSQKPCPQKFQALLHLKTSNCTNSRAPYDWPYRQKTQVLNFHTHSENPTECRWFHWC